MVDAGDVGVVEVQAMRQDAVQERRGWRRQRRPRTNGGGQPSLAQLAHAAQRDASEVEAGRGDGDAEGIEEMPLREVAHIGGDRIDGQAEGETGEAGRLGARDVALGWVHVRNPVRDEEVAPMRELLEGEADLQRHLPVSHLAVR
jgi:hypothetical protein